MASMKIFQRRKGEGKLDKSGIWSFAHDWICAGKAIVSHSVYNTPVCSKSVSRRAYMLHLLV